MVKRRKKPASEAQKRARERNWNKGQIKSIHTIVGKILEAKTTPEREKISLRIIMATADTILHNWTK